MPTWAIVPVKRLSEAKSSLSSRLTPEQRRGLVLCMVGDVLDALKKTPVKALVVSPDEEILNFASEQGAASLKEPGLNLNQALRLAVSHATEKGADSVLILPGDLPLLRPADVEGMISSETSSRAVVIAPSEEKGTNALFLRPPNAMDLKFGGESFPLHVDESLRVGIKPHVYRSLTIARDIDGPADLLSVETLGLGTRTHGFLRSLVRKHLKYRVRKMREQPIFDTSARPFDHRLAQRMFNIIRAKLIRIWRIKRLLELKFRKSWMAKVLVIGKRKSTSVTSG